MDNSLKIVLNGEACETSARSITELIAELKLAPETVLVEHQGRALHRSEWSARVMHEGDRVEILRVAAGG